MVIKEFDIVLDIKKTKQLNIIEVVQGDFETNIFNIEVQDEYQPVDLTGTTIEIMFAKPDNTTVMQDMESGVSIIDAAAGKVQVVLNTNSIAAPGMVHSELRIKEAGKIVTTARFSFMVRKAIVSNVVSSNEYPILEKLVEESQEAIEGYPEIKQAYDQMKEDMPVWAANEATRQANELVREQAESARAAAETSRAAAEMSRANAESVRVANESARQAAENARQGAEAARVAAENERNSRFETMIRNGYIILKKSVPTYADLLSTYPNPQYAWTVRVADSGKLYRWNEAEWEWIDTIESTAYDVLLNEVQAAKYSEPVEETAPIITIPSNAANGQVSVTVKGLTAINLLTNSGFDNSINGWTSTYNSTTISNGIVSVYSTGGYRHLTQPVPIIAGRKYYGKLRYKPNAENNSLTLNIHALQDNKAWETKQNIVTGSGYANTWSILTGILTATSDATYVGLGSYPTVGTTNYYDIDYAFLVDLTQTFGAGNEPTVEQCDKIFAKYFDGTKSTVCAMRLKSVGKNLFDGQMLRGLYQSTDGKFVNSNIYTCSKNKIKVNGGETITISTKNNHTGFIFVIEYNEKGEFIKSRSSSSHVTSATFTLGNTTKYIHVEIGNPSDHATPEKIGDFQVEFGSTKTSYEPYQENNAYTIAKDENGNIIELRSLPNNTKDEVSITEGKYTKKVSDTVSVSGTIFASLDTTTYVNVDVVKTTAFSSAAAGTTSKDGMTRLYDKNGAELSEVAQTDIDNAASVGKYYWHTDKTLWLIVAKGTYADITTARTALGTMTLIYQLAQPIVTEIPPQSITVKAGDTLYVEPAVKEQGIYSSTGIAIQNTSCPIKDMESVWKVTGDTETPVDISKVTIAGDGLSFTIMGAVAGERYRYVYLYDSSLTTLPTLRYSYPLNIAASISELNDLQSRLAAELGDVWMTLLPLADKELGMYMLTEISTPATATTEEIATKINEIINIWKG